MLFTVVEWLLSVPWLMVAVREEQVFDNLLDLMLDGDTLS